MNLPLINILTCLKTPDVGDETVLNVGYELHTRIVDCPESFVAHGWHGL
jgi:hypothetical protein